MNDTDMQKIKAFEAANRQIKICYGGDGSLVREWRSAVRDKKILLPVRDYARCGEHENFLDDLLNNPDKFDSVKRSLKMTLHAPVRCEFDGYDELALSEIFVTDDDVTEAMRFDVFVNGEKYLGNVIATAFLVSTPFGSTGYWSSVTRTIFREGYGLAFLAPTVGVSNLVLKGTDKIEIAFVRGCSATVAADKLVSKHEFKAGDRIRLETSPENVPIIGLAQFHCNECRAKRNGTVLSNEYLK
jgi:NAD kinase